MSRPLLGIVCGMEAEARALGRWRHDPRAAVAVSAGRPERAEAAARDLAGQGVRALVSWGIAGALDPALAGGTLLVPSAVIAPDGRRHALAADLLADAGHDAGHGGVAALLAGSESILFDAAAKSALRFRTGAAAVDMETHRVAAAAAAAGLPAVAVRAVSDPASRALPRLAAVALDGAGRPRIGAVLAEIARRPGDLPAMLAAWRDSRAALAALGSAAAALLPKLLARLESDGPPV